jgi:DNA-binding CsgD family transcriptional regulator
VSSAGPSEVVLRNQLVAVIRAVSDGGSLIDPKVVEGLVAHRARATTSPLNELTTRERDVLRKMAEGKNNASIGEDLVVTERSVEKVISLIFMKLGLTWEPAVHKRVKAVTFGPTPRISTARYALALVLRRSHRGRPRRPGTGSVGRCYRPDPRSGAYVTCSRREWPFRTAGGRRAGRPGSSPPLGWLASRPGRALCPCRCRGTAACPGRRPRGR